MSLRGQKEGRGVYLQGPTAAEALKHRSSFPSPETPSRDLINARPVNRLKLGHLGQVCKEAEKRLYLVPEPEPNEQDRIGVAEVWAQVREQRNGSKGNGLQQGRGVRRDETMARDCADQGEHGQDNDEDEKTKLGHNSYYNS